jgi:hypothetical protein
MAKKGKSGNSALVAANKIVAALNGLTDAEKQAAVTAALTLANLPTVGGVTARIVGTSQISPANDVITSSGEPRSSSRAKSPGELIQEKTPSTNPQLITLFAYYRERYEGKSRFSPTMLLDYFVRVREPKPKNFARDFAKAVRSGWIHEDGEESYVTSKGIEAVESGFDGKTRGPRGSSGKARKKKTSKLK